MELHTYCDLCESKIEFHEAPDPRSEADRWHKYLDKMREDHLLSEWREGYIGWDIDRDGSVTDGIFICVDCKTEPPKQDMIDTLKRMDRLIRQDMIDSLKRMDRLIDKGLHEQPEGSFRECLEHTERTLGEMSGLVGELAEKLGVSIYD